jgi:dienelactone hydrolase
LGVVDFPGGASRLHSRACRLASLLTALVLIGAASGAATAADDQARFGAFGPESPRLREQLWIMPGGAPGVSLRATVFRPGRELEKSPRPVVVINHGTSEAARLAQAMPVFYWLSRWFVERGYVVVLPERRGHGATGGLLAESVGSCADPDHYRSGLIAADDVAAVVAYMRRQSFADPDRITVAGISTGGWASLALASRNPPGVRSIVNFAGGRGGHAGGRPNAICSASRLIDAAGQFGKTARIPTLWLYSRNDSYFGPQLAERMAAAFKAGGGNADLHVLPPYEDDGHTIADDQDGWDLWGPALEEFLAAHDPETAAIAATAAPVSRPQATMTALPSSAPGPRGIKRAMDGEANGR